MVSPGFIEHPMVTAVKLADKLGAPYSGQFQWYWVSPEVVVVSGLETDRFNRAMREEIVRRFRRAGFKHIIYTRHKKAGWLHYCLDTETGNRRRLFE